MAVPEDNNNQSKDTNVPTSGNNNDSAQPQENNPFEKLGIQVPEEVVQDSHHPTFGLAFTTLDKIAYIIDVLEKEVKRERNLIEYLLYTCWSTYTNDPINLMVNSRSPGQGKSHPILAVLKLFPKSDVILLSGTSDKALQHEKGKLVIQDPDTEKWIDIEPALTKLEASIAEKENHVKANDDMSREDKKKIRNEIEEIKKEIKSLRGKASKLISLEHKILVFLDTPNQRLLEAIMPLLSHDEYYSKYKFVDKKDGKVETTDNVLWGWPTVIFSQTIDATTRARWPELARRFIVVNPTVTQEKVSDSVDLAIDSCSLPDEMYQAEVVKDREIEVCKNYVTEMRQDFLEFSKNLRQTDGTYDKRKSITFIPFSAALKASLPKSSDMNDTTTAKRFGRFLNLSTIINLNRRPILKVSKVMNNGESKVKEIPLATFEDTKTAIRLIGDAVNTGLRPEQKLWFKDVFLTTIQDKKFLDSKEEKTSRSKNAEIITKIEDVIALQLVELVKAHKSIRNEMLSTKQLNEKYLQPLFNNGLIEEDESKLDKRKKIYYPISSMVGTDEDLSKLIPQGVFSNFLEGNKLRLRDITAFPSEESIKSRIQSLAVQYGIGGSETALFDGRTNKAELDDIIQVYYSREQAEEVFTSDIQPSNPHYAAEGENKGESQGIRQEVVETTRIKENVGCKLGKEGDGINLLNNGESSKQEEERTGFLERNPQSDIRVSTKSTTQRNAAISNLLGQVNELAQEGKTVMSLAIKDSAISLDTEYHPNEAGGKIYQFGIMDVLTEKPLECIRITDPHIAGNYQRFVIKLVDAIHTQRNKNDKGEIIDDTEVTHEQSFGWWSLGHGCDLDKINKACKDAGVTSPIVYVGNKPTIEGQEHIDLYEIYNNRLAQGSFFHNVYRGHDLGHVGEKVVGLGKYKELTGPETFELPIEEQKAYNLRDCEITAKLAKARNGTLLALMKVISEIIMMPFDRTCHTTLTTWWANLFRLEGAKQAINPKTGEPYAWKYEGGLVNEPKLGQLTNIRVVDVASLYPTMSRKYNICFTSVCCQCCRDDPKAWVPKDVLVSRENPNESINREYWICRKQKGVFPKFLDEFTELRLQCKKAAKNEPNKVKQEFFTVMSDGLKVLVNGGYGCFAAGGAFDYQDVRVSELITAYGRYVLRQLRTIAAKYGLTVIYGDTDSAFLEGDAVLDDSVIRAFIEEANKALNIELEDAYLFKRVVITGKKHYMGVYYNDKEGHKCDEIIVKGLEGNKNDRPGFINRMQERFEQDFLEGKDPRPNMEVEIKRLINKELPSEDFKIFVYLHQDSYEESDIKYKMIQLMGAKKDDLVWYYKIHNGDTKRAKNLEAREGGYAAHQNPNNISYEKALDDVERTYTVLLEVMNLNPEQFFGPYREQVPKDLTDPYQTTFLHEGNGGGEEY